MGSYPSNQARTSEYLEKFDREKTLKYLIKNDSPIIIDVGANLGDTLDEFKLWWPNSSVYCFEPQEECWLLLSERANQYTEENVKVIKKAVGNKDGEKLVFYSHDISSGTSGFNKVNMSSSDSIQLNKLESGNLSDREKYTCQFNHEREIITVRLDKYFEEQNIKHVDLMKIDTQGFEPEVLEGAGSMLEHVDVILTELMFYDYYERSLSFSDIEKFLIPAGFLLYDINHISKNPMNGRTDWVDVIYVYKRLLGKSL